MEQETPMTAEEFLENYSLFDDIMYSESDEEGHKVSHVMDAYKDSHTTPLQAEIDRLKKDNESLKEQARCIHDYTWDNPKDGSCTKRTCEICGRKEEFNN